MPSAKCGAPEYRRLDVWIGDQDVVNRGRHAGVNLFTREEDGPLHGRWRGDRGSPGRSLPFRDRKTIRDGRYRRRGT
ncbi:MAG TPA: hypothetical protein VNK43_12365 [Gemmatimonadales bacterium]|nr:hypothetical protein [Gemmatimonadales bacterium]